MNPFDELVEIFRKFPGVGPRQAERFVYFLLRQPKGSLDKIGRLIPALSNSVKQCSDCYRYFISDHSNDGLCNICSDKNRDHSTLLIVGQDVDIKSIEKSDYNGFYFVLGGLVPILEKDPASKIRLNELNKILEKRHQKHPLSEVILALNANPDGENTTEIVQKEISDFCQKSGIKISILGRGLSTGTELEYSDAETIKNAIKNRF
ncbi:recombination protein RecR [Candidatus Parcubacteria bacterium]|nr:recombination protein RecR [Candidatus Parcubacteria bacterium]